MTILLVLCLTLTTVSGCASKKDEGEILASPNAQSDADAKEASQSGLPDRESATYAVFVGSIGEKIVEDVYPNAVKLPFDSISDAVMALKSGKADYVITAYTTCLNYVHAYPDELMVLPDKLTDEGCAIAVNKGETALLQDIDRVLEQFRADGTLERVISNWIREDGSDYVRDSIPQLADAPVLDVAVSAEREPLCYVENGVVTGMDAELIQRIAYEMGMRVEFHDMKYSALIPSVLSGRTPVATSNITATQERKQSVNFSSEYYVNPQTFLTRTEFMTTASSAMLPLETAHIGSVTGTTYENYIYEKYPDTEYSSFSSMSDLMQALKSGKIDYAISDQMDAINYQRGDNKYNYVVDELDNHDVCIPVKKGNTELLNSINSLLEQYSLDGTLNRLKSNWIRTDGSDYVQDEIPKITEGRTLTVAFCSELEPFCFIKDGEPTGYDVELAKRLAYDMGCKIEFMNMQFSSLIAAVESGRADFAISGIAQTQERAQKVDFSVPYYQSVLAVVSYNTEKTAESQGFMSSFSESFRKTFIAEDRWKMVASGIGITLLISVCSGVLGIVIGFGFCMLKRSRLHTLGAATTALTRLLQGTPIVVLLMILYYVVFNKTGLDGISVAVIAFGLNFGAYASEIMLSGIGAVDKGQSEAAAALGFTPSKTFAKIIFPQAARHFLPVLKGEFISLVKMTSVVGYVAVQDLTKISDIIRSRTYEAFFPLIATAIIYFLLSFGMSSLLGMIEVRIDPKRRPRTLKGVKLS